MPLKEIRTGPFRNNARQCLNTQLAETWKTIYSPTSIAPHCHYWEASFTHMEECRKLKDILALYETGFHPAGMEVPRVVLVAIVVAIGSVN